MNTLSGGWIGDDLVAELASQSVQNAVLGFQYPGLVLSHTCLDEIEAFDRPALRPRMFHERADIVGEQAHICGADVKQMMLGRG